MIDSHCHLDHEPLFNNIDDILKRSKDVGIEKLLTICTTFESFDKIKQLIKKDDPLRLNTIVFTTLEIVRKISFLLYPIIPKSTLKALKIFSLDESDINFSSIGNNEFLIKDSKINKIDILFKKIEKDND